MISDFDKDGYDDFIIRSDWGMGIIGNDADDNIVLKALTPYGTDIGDGWVLSASDEVVAVGKFGRAESAGQMVLKGTTGFGFVRAHEGGLQAVTVVPYGDRITGEGFDWLVGPDDKVIGVGRLNGIADCLVVTSDWSVGVWAPRWSGTPMPLGVHQNQTAFQGPDGRTWELDTTDPRFQLLGVSDIDMHVDRRDEMVLMSSSGLAVLHENGSGVWNLKFFRPDGEPVFDAVVGTDPDRLIHMADFDKSGGADLLFQHEDGITVLGKARNAAPDSPWTFGVIGEHGYGSSSGGWELSEGDLLLPLAGDFDGDGQYDFAITSAWGLSILTRSGSAFEEIALAPYQDLPISSSLQIVGVGKFDHSGRHRLLFRNLPVPPNGPSLTGR